MKRSITDSIGNIDGALAPALESTGDSSDESGDENAYGPKDRDGKPRESSQSRSASCDDPV